MSKTKAVKKKFAEELKRCCLLKYKTMPSNSTLAKDLHIASLYKLKVNQETFRLWLKGDSFPDLDSLMFLIEWLNLDVNKFFINSKYSNEKVISQNSIKSDESIELLDIKSIDSLIETINLFKKYLEDSREKRRDIHIFFK